MTRVRRALPFIMILSSSACVGETGSVPDTTSEAAPTVTAGALTSSAVPSAPDDEYLQAPGGFGRIHKSCSHKLPKGGRLDPNGDVYVGNKKVDKFLPCRYPAKKTPPDITTREGGPAPTVNGWMESDWQWASTNGYGYNWFNGLGTEMLLEDYAPTSHDGQIIFIFPSLEPSNAASIIQPVLQYGASCGGGGNYWSMENFYVYCPTTDPNYPSCKVGDTSTALCVYDEAVAVYTGDTIDAFMAVDWENPGCNSAGQNCNWRIGWEDETTSANNVMMANPPDSFTTAQFAVLEAYGIGQCSDLPTQVSGTPSGGILDFINSAVYQPGPGVANENSVTVSPSSIITNGMTPSCGYWMYAGDHTDIELGWNAGL